MTLPKVPPRTHHLLICLWAEGHPVDVLMPDATWAYCPGSPLWLPAKTYSIKLPNSRLISDPTGFRIDLDEALPTTGESNVTS